MKEADEKTKKINLDSIIYFIIFLGWFMEIINIYS